MGQIDFSPLWVTLKTGIVASVFSFFIGIAFAELVNTTISDTDALTVDHEYRITLLELGIDDTEGDAETT